ncbi:MAG: ferrous iron transport protein B [Peptococcaceae bacterium]|nr:ferrous iron transport protein B [Peptococcaceae bacterium]
MDGRLPASGRKIVLAGNPNVGKSVFFNALTGLYADISNYPGTTLDIACGRCGGDVVIDTPGVYGVSSLNEEEKITRDIILAADIVVNVVDAVHLERDLFLTLQIIDMGVPLVVALNMVDEAAREGLKIDVPLLEKLLGVPVVSTVAVRGAGLEELKRKLALARPGLADPALLEKIRKLSPPADRREALLILEGDCEVSGRLGLPPGNEREAVYRARRERVNRIVARVVRESGENASFAARLGQWMLQPACGFPLLALTLWLVYELVGVFLAQTVIDYTQGLMEHYYEPAVRSLLGGIFPPGSFTATVLAGQYGLLTLTVTYLFGLLLPLVTGIFLMLAVFEDTGYLPRIATLVDRTLAGLGLNGQAVIPLILGFGCVTMACITTRLLPTGRERRIAIFLLALGVPCSAQTAVVTAVMAGLGAAALFMYAAVILSILLAAGVLLGRLLPGSSSPLIIELPPLRLPRLQNVLKKSWLRSYGFIKEASPLFAGGMLFLSLLEVTGLLGGLRDLLVPVTVGWLHLPPEIADVFIMGIIRKEFGAAFILNLQLLPVQQVVVMITLTLTVPCIASTIVIFKERGWREGLMIWLAIFTIAFCTGGMVTRLLEAFSASGMLQTPALYGMIFLFPAVVLVLARLCLLFLSPFER